MRARISLVLLLSVSMLGLGTAVRAAGPVVDRDVMPASADRRCDSRSARIDVIDRTVQVVTGTIEISGHGSFSGVEQFTALDALASTDLLDAIINVSEADPVLARHLEKLRDMPGNPTNFEFLTATIPHTELVFTGFIQRPEGGLILQWEEVRRPSPVQNIFDVGEIQRKTIGERTASKSSSIAPAGTFTVTLAGGTETRFEPGTKECIDVTTNGNVTVDLFRATAPSR